MPRPESPRGEPEPEKTDPGPPDGEEKADPGPPEMNCPPRESKPFYVTESIFAFLQSRWFHLVKYSSNWAPESEKTDPTPDGDEKVDHVPEMNYPPREAKPFYVTESVEAVAVIVELAVTAIPGSWLCQFLCNEHMVYTHSSTIYNV